MIIVTTENVPGHETVRVLGACFGIVVRSRGAIPNITAGVRSIFGGEIPEYTRLLESARNAAMERLSAHAAQLGGNAVLMMRFDGSEIAQSMSEIVAYGTAAVIQPVSPTSTPQTPWNRS